VNLCSTIAAILLDYYAAVMYSKWSAVRC